MAIYTTEIRTICEYYAGNQLSNGSNYNDIINNAIPYVFDFDFPIYDDAYKNVLCGKILKHYYTREIGLETVALWKLKLDTKMNEIMPFYNQLYESALLEFNPLYDVDVWRAHDSEDVSNRNETGDSLRNASTNSSDNATNTYTTTGNTKSNGTNNRDNWDLFSDTPQGGVNGIKSGTNQYLSNARNITDNNTQTNSQDTSTNSNERLNSISGSSSNENSLNHVISNINSTGKYIEHVAGKQGGESYADMLLKYRETLINIDMMIIDELSDLFMNIW